MILPYIKRLGTGYLVGFVIGLLFMWIQVPLPWILGPLVGIFIVQLFTQVEMQASLPLRKVSFTIMGIQIGTTFTATTFTDILPYIIPYEFFTLLLIAISLVASYLLAKWLPIDPITSMLGSIPGGLSAIIALSDAVKGNTGLVTIFHTIRLLSVLLIVPFAATHYFVPVNSTVLQSNVVENQGSIWTAILYVVIYFIALAFEKRLPAGLVIIPMLLVGALQILPIQLFILPNGFYIFAQLTLGIYLGCSISLKDIQKAGKFALFYFLLSVLLIVVAGSFGYLFSMYTEVDLATAMLSFAPGGLVEMALTAQSVGSDSSIVSSLQTIRLLTIVLLVPVIIQLILPKFVQSRNQ
ncbi:AbrB family transcriptional regulator [Paraliobacillus sediminis]|uniref:AbrB family transcriptional regulator n=1 Tax=Paraliobacillus sediminis TaxID=1885916 RepID=UPI000E3BB23C|nr:AbrB family transcriptional regulator [Paraliobacillus sediminis]